ncbi:hypothetical protein GXM_05785 [Nostoc sphaeroides CCNUC1]|uniref:Uncharacterized protein n=1 Tax=Nostoc sphaeroides CCNUC1 TaxID=2653204 RepID=A0A5P8W695_9NOSO|nr:hypothetical protein GXM_05785 [Nostoc sphaeroides CCNUC1]
MKHIGFYLVWQCFLIRHEAMSTTVTERSRSAGVAAAPDLKTRNS